MLKLILHLKENKSLINHLITVAQKTTLLMSSIPYMEATLLSLKRKITVNVSEKLTRKQQEFLSAWSALGQLSWVSNKDWQHICDVNSKKTKETKLIQIRSINLNTTTSVFSCSRTASVKVKELYRANLWRLLVEGGLSDLTSFFMQIKKQNTLTKPREV